MSHLSPKQALERWKKHDPHDEEIVVWIHNWVKRNSGFAKLSDERKVTNIGGSDGSSKRTMHLGLTKEEFHQLLAIGSGDVSIGKTLTGLTDKERQWAAYIMPGVLDAGGAVQAAHSVSMAAPGTSSSIASVPPVMPPATGSLPVPAVAPAPSGTQPPASAAPAPPSVPPSVQHSADPAMDAQHLRKLKFEYAALQATAQQSPAALFIEMFWQRNPMKSRASRCARHIRR